MKCNSYLDSVHQVCRYEQYSDIMSIDESALEPKDIYVKKEDSVWDCIVKSFVGDVSIAFFKYSRF